MKQKPSEIFEKSWEESLIRRGVLGQEKECWSKIRTEDLYKLTKNIQFDFPDKYEWMLGRDSTIFIGKSIKPQQGYYFDIWEIGKPTKSIALFKTKTAGEMARKIVRLASKLS